MIDLTQNAKSRVLAAPADPSLPLGICAPQYEGDIGWDLVAAARTPIPPQNAVNVPVNLRLQLPPGYYVDIRNRSSMGRRNLYVDQNLVDNGYRGMLYVFVRNMNLPLMRAVSDAQMAAMQRGGLILPGQENGGGSYEGPNVFVAPPELDPGTVVIEPGERIGQLVFHRSDPVWIEAVEAIDPGTDRGEAGMGSTGL